MQIKSKVIPPKVEYSRKRNKCPCCTRDNYRLEMIRRLECKEAELQINSSAESNEA